MNADDLIYSRDKPDVTEITTRHQKIKQRGGFHKLSAAEQAEYLKFMGKGAYSAADINRVESVTRLLIDKLDSYGYTKPPPRITKTNWTMTDTPTRADIDRIRDNINYLQGIFVAIPEWRDILYNNTMGFEQANTLEWDLYHIDLWLQRMAAAWQYCGTFFCGEDAVWLGVNYFPGMRRRLIDGDGYALVDSTGRALYVRY